MTAETSVRVEVWCPNPLCSKVVHTHGRKKQQLCEVVVPEGVIITVIDHCRSCRQVQVVEVSG